MKAKVLVSVAAATALIAVSLGTRAFHADAGLPPCRMAPSVVRISLSHEGFMWLEGEAETGACAEVPREKWIRKPSGPFDLYVYADGPSGSGRYWTITVGIAKAGTPKPARGFCLATSTIGWRTLQQYKVSPLPWIDDLDGDGKAEVILWDSFPLRPEATMAELGLTAWVYRPTSEGSLVLDWDLTRKLARDIAAAYRVPLKTAPPNPSPLRPEAAAALEMFADGRCTVAAEESR